MIFVVVLTSNSHVFLSPFGMFIFVSSHACEFNQDETKSDSEGRRQQRDHQKRDSQQPVPPRRNQYNNHRTIGQSHTGIG